MRKKKISKDVKGELTNQENPRMEKINTKGVTSNNKPKSNQ